MSSTTSCFLTRELSLSFRSNHTPQHEGDPRSDSSWTGSVNWLFADKSILFPVTDISYNTLEPLHERATMPGNEVPCQTGRLRTLRLMFLLTLTHLTLPGSPASVLRVTVCQCACDGRATNCLSTNWSEQPLWSVYLY